jgi:bifunctional oligoribonuclease and PAP phosphatase NrnA
MKFAAQLEPDLQNIKSKLTNPQDIVILSHRNPDGDAIGSSIGLKLFLEQLHHQVKIILPSEYPVAFSYLTEGIAAPIIYDLEQERAVEAIQQADIIFTLDFNALDRIDKLGDKVMFSNALKIMIDHHIDPEPFPHFTISDTTASSTSELVYLFIKDLGYEKLINTRMGEAILTGIITDTGSFKYATRPLTYLVAGELKAKGIDDYSIQNRIFNSLEPKYLKILGHCLANRMVMIYDNKAAYIYLTKDDYTTYGIGRGDTEGIVNYLLMVKDVQLAAIIMEQPSIIKISLRSKNEVNVQQLAAQHFNGGGHKNASGGSAYAKLEDITSRFEKVVQNYLN